MAAVTQQIPNYVLGISEQPDELKSPGQVVDLKNAIPDITRGLIKRPGSQFVGAITPSAGELKWFSMYTDEDNQFIGQVATTGEIKVWAVKCKNNSGAAVEGVSIPVAYDIDGTSGDKVSTDLNGDGFSNYLDSWTNQDEIQDLTINESTFLVNRNQEVAMTNTKSADFIHEAIVELKTLSPSKQYALDIHDPTSNAEITEWRATALSIDENVTYSGISDKGECEGQGREVVNAPNNLRYEVDTRCVPVLDEASNTDPAQRDYKDSYQPYVTLQFGGENWTDDGAGSTDNVHTHQSSKGITTTVTVTKHIKIKTRASIAAVRPPATSSRADESITSSGILGDMKETLDAIGGTGITATKIGNCLHLSRATAFSVNTPEQTLMNIVTSEANSVADLPTTCRHGMVVQIVNSAEDDDDFFLKFKANNNDIGSNETLASPRFGKGVWVECPKPNLEIELDKTTLPVKLVREEPSGQHANGRFLVQTPQWLQRDVGDDTTNPKPSFVGQKINKLLFFRNRLVMLSGDNLITSVSNQFFKFWSKTAMTTTASDPIDLLCGSTFPTQLYDGIEVNTGLILFSSNQQFMLTTDSDEFSPETAKINYLCSYNYNHKTLPFSIGTTAGFINSTGNNARFYEMDQIRREGEPLILEQSKVISKLFPIDITMPVSSRENGILFFGSKDKREVWGWRHFSTGQKRALQSWFRWELPGTLTYHTVLDDVYYAVVKSGTSYNIEGFDIKQQSDTTTISHPNDTKVYDVYLDSIQSFKGGNRPSNEIQIGYSASTGRSGVTKPAGFIHSDRQLAAFCISSTAGGADNNIGRFALASVVSNNIEWDGDWTDNDVIIGYVYDWEVELPTLYRQQMAGEKVKSDTKASLVVQRLHFKFGSVGYISSTLKRKGREDYTDTYESLDWDNYTASRMGITDEYTHTVPAYERNTNLTVELKSSHPSPATLHSLVWEGDYNNRYYQRV